ncbi:MAG TPA: LytR C-terminal domain-containing protein [Nocardioidaceae bacterium]|nr:LytR C-terminal domain-containing protein [Nocardioidaceae bacterium]
MRGRHLSSGITLLVLTGILVAGALYGVKSLFAPIPDSTSTADSPRCVQTSVKKGQRLTSRQVTVSVYNAGNRAGLADQTLASLTRRGFRPGAVGNAPEDSRVRVAQVWTTGADETAARLVAQQFGRGVAVRRVRTDLGPGIDVVVGNGFRRLVRAPTVTVARRASSVCVPRTGSS